MPRKNVMDENKLRFGVGVLVISAIGIGIILTFLFGAFPNVLSQDYTLLVRFPSAAGIGLNTNVVRDGVRIGHVSDIELHPDGGVLVTLEMQKRFRSDLSHRYIPQIGSGNLVSGDAQIEFVKGTATDLEKNWGTDLRILDEPYSELEEAIDYGKVSPGFFEMQDDLVQTFDAIKVAGESIAQAGNSVNELAVELRGTVGGTDGKVNRVADEAVKALEEFQGAMRDVRSIVGNPKLRESLEASVNELPELLRDARTTLDKAQETFQSFERAGDQFEKVGAAAERTISGFQNTVENLEQFSEPLAENSDELVAQVMHTLASLDRALVQVEGFGSTLNNSDGSLKRFLEDDEIYYRIRRTIENIEQASARVRPILDDVRIFTDKVARDPRQLGVRGAISKRPSGAGLK